MGTSKGGNKTVDRAEKGGMERILAAAVSEFGRAGLARAKLDFIAAQAGVSNQLIHHYFGTKADLYVAVISDITGTQIDILSSLDYESLAPTEAVRLFLNTVFDFFAERPFLAGLFNDQSLYSAEHIPECRNLMARSPELMLRLNEVLARGQKSGEFSSPINAKEAYAAGMMVVIGCFTNGPILSSLVDLDFSVQQNIKNWREFSVNYALAALRP